MVAILHGKPHRSDPTCFAAAGHWGGFAAGLIVLLTAFPCCTGRSAMNSCSSPQEYDNLPALGFGQVCERRHTPMKRSVPQYPKQIAGRSFGYSGVIEGRGVAQPLTAGTVTGGALTSVQLRARPFGFLITFKRIPFFGRTCGCSRYKVFSVRPANGHANEEANKETSVHLLPPRSKFRVARPSCATS